MSKLFLNSDHGGMMIDREVELHIIVPIDGSASNGAVLDHVQGILTNALAAAKAEFRIEHVSVRRTM
jgi:hypothetical protein